MAQCILHNKYYHTINGRIQQSSMLYTFDRKYKYISYLSFKLILHIVWIIVGKMMNSLFVAVFSINRITWAGISIRACSRLFLIVNLRYVFRFFKQKENSFIKRSQSSNGNFRIHTIWMKKTDYFTTHAKPTSISRRNKK